MSGIYIHIPFCDKACHYCDFHFSTANKNIDPMILAIIKEIKSRKKEVKEIIKTIYFGGGTPSLLSATQLNKILQTIKNNLEVSENAEITLEANPEDLDEEKLKSFFKMGINRLSIGVQSLNDNVLKWMNRNHNSEQAIKSIEIARRIGFKNISVDFIYGTPEKIIRKWQEELQYLIKLPIQHVSAYHLTIEPKTFFANQLKKGLLEPLEQEASYNEYNELIKILYEKKIFQYEVSNFSIEGFYSKHNTSYWQQKKYLGIGPSAHSYDGNKRRWNKPNNTLYIKSINNNTSYYETEILSTIDKFNELIMVGLRTKIGFSYQKAVSFLNTLEQQQFRIKLDSLYLSKTIKKIKDQISMETNKLMLAEHATRELFILKE